MGLTSNGKSFVRRVLTVMGDFEKILSQMDKEVSAEFISQYNQKQSEYRNRILNAQATGGDEAAQNETVAILREQLAEFDSYAAAYRAMGDSAIEIDNRRLEMLIRLHDEMNKGAQKEAQSMQMSFQAASDLAGALGGLARRSWGERAGCCNVRYRTGYRVNGCSVKQGFFIQCNCLGRYCGCCRRHIDNYNHYISNKVVE